MPRPSSFNENVGRGAEGMNTGKPPRHGLWI